VRKSDILLALPLAVKLAFVKSSQEVVADLHFLDAPATLVA